MKILIAEDTKDLNRVLTVALEHEGYTVDSALDGEIATEFIEKNGYDVIILDIMMPKKDGITVLKELRGQHITTPVLMLTAKAEVDDRVLGLDAGADDYLAKPFAMKELLARVRAMVRRKTTYEAFEEKYGDLIISSTTYEVTCENTLRLSVKEFELLQMLIQQKDSIVSIESMLRSLWPGEDASESTVVLYVMYLQGKLKAINSKVSIAGDQNNGYKIAGE